MTDDLDRLLPLIDEPPLGIDAETVDAEARVWARITGEVVEVRRSDGAAGHRPSRGRRARPLSIAAVGVAVVAGLVAIGLLRRDTTTPADAPTTTAVVFERSEACARFVADGTPFGELDAGINAGDPSVLDRFVVAIDRLRPSLVAIGVEQAQLDALEQVRGSVVQAELHVSDGDPGAALVALEFANRVYTASGLFDDRCLG